MQITDGCEYRQTVKVELWTSIRLRFTQRGVESPCEFVHQFLECALGRCFAKAAAGSGHRTNFTAAHQGGSCPFPPRRDQAGTCIMVELGNGDRFFFDFGPGCVKNILAMGVPVPAINDNRGR